MSNYKQIIYDESGRIARVRMNRPAVRNAQSMQLLEELDAAFLEACASPDVRVIVLSGEGPSFSSGHDLGTPERLAELASRPRPPELTELETTFLYSYGHMLEMSLRWRDLPKPTIAQVHGWCIFGGWLIASAMDLIVASSDARFLTSFIQYFPLPYDIGVRQAKRIVFDPRPLSAMEALELGFVTHISEPCSLEQETLALAERIAEHSPFWLRMAKMSINGTQDAAGFRSSVVSAHAHHLLAFTSEREERRRAAGFDPTPPLPGARRRPQVERVLSGEDERERLSASEEDRPEQ
jgi:enoyl-CoA hydratase